MPQCHECGTEIAAARSAGGLCPRCLIKQVIDGSRAAADLSLSEQETLATLAPDRGDPTASTCSDLSPGERFGSYEIVRLLGKGGMGVVYEANDRNTGRRVALKVLAEDAASPADRERFLREGRLAAQVSHPNSVYVFGTEEIDGIQAIAMELIPGGTLKDRVDEKGPMAVAEAVDATLDLVAGLEAAHAKGVLHRDIKPANCFVDTDGAVKIGDFGLSISTLPQGEPRLTTKGTLMGTPSFASPEQIQGNELDVRSDVYSLGATLYCLLTGKPPLEADGVVELIAKILQENPALPTKLRPEVPKGLATVVLRFLRKDPSKRPEGYPEVRQALLPYSSSVPTPARLNVRFGAGVIDAVILFVAVQVFLAALTDFLELWGVARPGYLVTLAVCVSYFALLEGIWGASLGKAMVGLRVVASGANIAGLGRAGARGLVWWIAVFIAYFAAGWANDLLTDAVEGILGQALEPLLVLLWTATFLWLMFATAREANGFAGVHDLLSDTRVVHKTPRAAPVSRAGKLETVSITGNERKLGPYVVLDPLGQDGGSALLRAFDPTLRRTLWVRVHEPSTPAVPAARRAVARRGRLRWLYGERDAESWDAYEGLDGQPFVSLVGTRPPWREVRVWLADLADELIAALEDGTLPERLSLDRIWITTNGRAKVLDFPAPGADPLSVDPTPPDFASIQRFLYQVALCTVSGTIIDSAEAADQPLAAAPLPLPARSLLDELAAQSFDDPDNLSARFDRTLREATHVTRWRRASVFACYAAFPLVGMISYLVLGIIQMSAERRLPDLVALNQSVRYLQSLPLPSDRDATEVASESQAMEIMIASRFGDTVGDPSFATDISIMIAVGPANRDLARRIVAEHPTPSQEQVDAATRDLAAFLDSLPDRVQAAQLTRFKLLVRCLGLATGPLSLYFMGALVFAVFLPGGVLLRLIEIGVVDKRGRPVGRLHSVARCVIAFSPVLASYVVVPPLAALFLSLDDVSAQQFRQSIEPTLGVVMIAAVAYAVWRPQRGLQDLIAGTYLVPR